MGISPVVVLEGDLKAREEIEVADLLLVMASEWKGTTEEMKIVLPGNLVQPSTLRVVAQGMVPLMVNTVQEAISAEPSVDVALEVEELVDVVDAEENVNSIANLDRIRVASRLKRNAMEVARTIGVASRTKSKGKWNRVLPLKKLWRARLNL